ncbi:PUA-like domain-containing protein [Lentinula lateritia]|uniref:PUA-like domain-containing protein n=1 Tax=Lentinula lateritia TaxID=40482 RepID=A0ABQ8VD40_9AGAR|nr:PUA-like domain-containing protein [Lentinula lateritia]
MPDPRNIFKNRYKKQTKTYGYGKVAGIEVGTILSSRQECSDRGLHGPTQAGIHGNATYGAYSVVLSGGYEDDEDNGERVWYTGEGGRKNGGGPQIADQDWKNKNNRSLKISCAPDRYPIRVIRGHTLHSRYAPSWGYRYDGLYRVAKAIQVRGKAGKLLCKFLFVVRIMRFHLIYTYGIISDKKGNLHSHNRPQDRPPHYTHRGPSSTPIFILAPTMRARPRRSNPLLRGAQVLPPLMVPIFRTTEDRTTNRR